MRGRRGRARVVATPAPRAKWPVTRRQGHAAAAAVRTHYTNGGVTLHLLVQALAQRLPHHHLALLLRTSSQARCARAGCVGSGATSMRQQLGARCSRSEALITHRAVEMPHRRCQLD